MGLRTKLVVACRAELVLARQAIDRGDIHDMAAHLFKANGVAHQVIGGAEEAKMLGALADELRIASEMLELETGARTLPMPVPNENN